MTSLSQFFNPLFSKAKEQTSLSSSRLINHDKASKLEALTAVDILIQYKSTVHEFTDEIIAFWALPRKVMDRYHFDDAEQLNEWLDGFSYN